MSSRRTSSPPPAAGPSRDPSVRSPSVLQHVPVNPSTLRESHSFASSSPEDTRSIDDHLGVDGEYSRTNSAGPSPRTFPTHPAESEEDEHASGFSDLGHRAVTETTALLRRPFEFVAHPAHSGPCDHGTFSPRLESRAESVRSGYGFGGSIPADYDDGRDPLRSGSVFGSFLYTVGLNKAPGGKKKMSTTNWLAEQHGITNTTSMYVKLSP